MPSEALAPPPEDISASESIFSSLSTRAAFFVALGFAAGFFAVGFAVAFAAFFCALNKTRDEFD